MEITEDILKSGHRLRTGGNFEKTSITIHSTGNPNSTAANERAWLDNPSNSREAAWHYVIDENKIIQAMPDNETAWHCGDSYGNKHSIGVEICESGDRTKTLEKAAQFVAEKMKEYNFDISNILRHHDWTGKNCPRILIDNDYIKDGMGWEWFINKVKSYFEGGEEVEKIYNWTLEVPEWARPTVQKLLDKGYLKGNGKGELGLTETAIKLLVINDRAKLYD